MKQCIPPLEGGNLTLVIVLIRVIIMREPNKDQFEVLEEFFSILLRKGKEYPKKTLDILTLLFSDKWKDLSTEVFATLLQNDTGQIFSHVFMLIFAPGFHGELADFVMSKLAIYDIFCFFWRTYKAVYYKEDKEHNMWYMNLKEYLRVRLVETLLECIPQKSIKELEKCFIPENSLLIRQSLTSFFMETIGERHQDVKLILKIDLIQVVFIGKVVYEIPRPIVHLRKILYCVETQQIEQLERDYEPIFLEKRVSPTTTGRYFEFFIMNLLDPAKYEPYQSLVLDILKELLSSSWRNLTAFYVFRYNKILCKEI